MRRKQCEKAVTRKAAPEGFEPDPLQHHIAVWVAKDFFADAVTARQIRIGQLKRRDTRRKWPVLEPAVPLFFGEESQPVGHDKAHIASAGLIHPRKIDLVQNAVAQREPHFAMLIERSA